MLYMCGKKPEGYIHEVYQNANNVCVWVVGLRIVYIFFFLCASVNSKLSIENVSEKHYKQYMCF